MQGHSEHIQWGVNTNVFSLSTIQVICDKDAVLQIIIMHHFDRLACKFSIMLYFIHK